ncbi:protein adenylyltransferase SelO [Thalassoglobus sp. JC818]|uniref:protein adenylyltransferase SelO n=1 Tax=Thalassoglobus sp. JC818 TaxID=3232136 RepID=UPI00345AC412
MNSSTISLNFEHSYAEHLPDFFAEVKPTPVQKPSLLQFNTSLASELGIDDRGLTPELVPRIFSGNELPRDARPIAQIYAGHQFGNFVPQLGDGRALLLGEVIDRQGKRRDIALKGSGRTPMSRGGDGKAAVGPVLREYLLGEAMHALGIPTTRALAAVATGEPVMRERPLPGAVLTRVAASHVRVGTFQYFAARRQTEHVRKLADYVIQRHYPEVNEADDRYLALLQSVVQRQADLIARWMLVGFIHGVMNTDNMAISGETIDYGPCAFMETYDPAAVFSSIDHAGRYAYGNQPAIALWNLARFAETLLPLLGDENSERAVADATAILETFLPRFEQHWYNGAWTKLGLADSKSVDSLNESECALVDDWLELLKTNKVDYTLAWRALADFAEGDESPLRSLFKDQTGLENWLARWTEFQGEIDPSRLASTIRAVNPLYIPRNHLVEEALAAASNNGDLSSFEALLSVVQHPFDENPQLARYAEPAPMTFTANYQTFCGT